MRVPVVALVAGILVALTCGNPWQARTRRLAHQLLALSVIGLGAGMDLRVVGRVGLHGLGYTAVTIGVALGLGTVLARALRVGRDAGLLISVGTAICGGSAIAAIAPAIDASDEDTSMALATVFTLNAVALVIFPPIGHALGLSQEAFGLWSALAIHDTSSVVGAASQYGAIALSVATAAKLARALWIVPVSLAVSRGRATKRPWFIAGFLGAAALVTFVPALQPAGHAVASGAHYLLAATLFLVGMGLTRASLRRLGLRPLVLAVLLWIVLGGGTLLAVYEGWIA